MTSCKTLSTALLFFAALCSVAARAEDRQPPPGSQPAPPAAEHPETTTARDLSWRRSDISVALLNHGNMVWEYVHDARIGKPYMRFGLLDGTELTRPWPYPDDYPKNDHTWHRALWWSWKAINGVNYWEGNQTGTEPVEVAVATGPDGSARIELDIAYRPPNEPPVLLEKRRVTVTAPDAAGTYLIDWEAGFTPAGAGDVRFDQNSYGGFALRMAAECCGDAGREIPAWTFGNSEGHADVNNRAARWVSFQGTTANGQAACVAIFDHPDNPRHPTLWQTRAHYPYLNPSLTCKEAYLLPSGTTLSLRYGVLVSVGSVDANTLEKRWKAFAQASTSSGSIAKAGRREPPSQYARDFPSRTIDRKAHNELVALGPPVCLGYKACSRNRPD